MQYMCISCIYLWAGEILLLLICNAIHNVNIIYVFCVNNQEKKIVKIQDFNICKIVHALPVSNLSG